MDEKRPHWEAWWRGGRKGAMTYSAYTRAVQHWVEQASHSGPQPSDSLAKYTKLNAFRMQRVEKTIQWPPELLAILLGESIQNQHWVLITESWCGDAAQTVPLIGAMAERANIPLDVVLRDGANGIIQDFLTNGGKSIPLWIVSSQNGEVMGQWGPRPRAAQKMVTDYKAAPEPKSEYQVFAGEVQKWYARDRGSSFFSEAANLMVQPRST